MSPRIPERGEIDVQKFHAEEGRKYLAAFALLSVVTVVINAALGQGGSASQWPAQNLVIVPMSLATGIAAIFIRRSWAQILALAIQSCCLQLILLRLESKPSPDISLDCSRTQ